MGNACAAAYWPHFIQTSWLRHGKLKTAVPRIRASISVRLPEPSRSPRKSSVRLLEMSFKCVLPTQCSREEPATYYQLKNGASPVSDAVVRVQRTNAGLQDFIDNTSVWVNMQVELKEPPQKAFQVAARAQLLWDWQMRNYFEESKVRSWRGICFGGRTKAARVGEWNGSVVVWQMVIIFFFPPYHFCSSNCS